MSVRETFEALTATGRALVVIATTVTITASVLMTATALGNRWRGLPAQQQAIERRFEADSARTDARIDSIALAALERVDRIRAEIREESARGAETRRLLDELVCVLSAQARGTDPQQECRDPLPLVPVPGG